MTQPRFDLVVRNGTVVTPGHREQAGVGISDGRIAQLGEAMTGHEEIDAGGLLVLPGGIDAHVHLVCAEVAAALAAEFPGEPPWVDGWVDDFWTGSLAAIGGGITTVGNMTFAMPGESMTTAIAREMTGARAEAAVDWFLHPVLTGVGEAERAEVAALAASGHTSVKVCSCPIPTSPRARPAWPRSSPRPARPGPSPWCTARTPGCWSGRAAS